MQPVLDIAFIGTSLTSLVYGHHWQSDLTSALLPMSPRAIRCYNLGTPGGTSADGLARLLSAKALKAEIVIIELCVNDPSKGITVDGMDANCMALIQGIRSVKEDTTFFLMTMNPVKNSQQAAILPYYERYRVMAARENIGLIDNYPSWPAVPSLAELPDDVHPTLAAFKQYSLPNLVAALAPLLNTSSSQGPGTTVESSYGPANYSSSGFA